MRMQTGRASRGRQRAAGVEILEGRRLPSGLFVEGSAPGRAPLIRVLDADTGAERLRFAPFGARPAGGVRVAVGDVDGDGTLDIVATGGPRDRPMVRVFRAEDGARIGGFDLPRAWAGAAVAVATGDVTGDGRADIVVAPTAGAPRVRVFEGLDGRLVGAFRADAGADADAAPGTWRGARLAVGDVDGDGRADIAATPVAGPAVVRVFGGASLAPIAQFQAFPGAVGGRTDIALADVDGNRRPDVVVAAPRGRAVALRAFDGATGQLLGRAEVAGATGGGARIAAVNLGGRGADELVVGSGRAGAAVLASNSWRFAAATSTATTSTAAATPAVAYRLGAGSAGASFAGDNSVAVATPAVAAGNLEPPLSQALPVLQRLAYYDPTSGQFVPVAADDPRLAGKDITVITHGWAPGYVDWVDHEAEANGRVLKWWETFPGQPNYDAAWASQHPQAPASAFLLQGTTASTIFGTTPVTPTGLAQSILARAAAGTDGPVDPRAAVLAYSWIDDSATPTWDFLTASVPEEAYRSEALTTLNGERLAAALGQALGTSFGGKVQLVGHSHGSKVVSVAAVAAQAEGLPIAQVTTLDSPEDDVTVAGDAANFNWYFLKDLRGLDRSRPGGVLVDNAISEFGIPYSGVRLSDGTGANLSQIVDVGLVPDVYDSYDLGDRHGYSAAWYAGSGEPSVTYEQTVGQYWSPLLPANAGASSPVPNLPAYSVQAWDEFSQLVERQYSLLLRPGPPEETITFAPLDAPAVALTQAGTIISSPPVTVRAPYYGQSGIAFDYLFAGAKPGDRLIILADGKPAFAMDADLVGPGPAHATISLDSLPFEAHALTFVLTSTTPNTTSRVAIANFRTFDQPLTDA